MKKILSFCRRAGAAVFSFFVPLCPAVAQDVIWSPPQAPATPAVVQAQENSNPMQVFAPSVTAPPLPLQWGPVRLHPHVDYVFSYGNGLQSSPGQSEDSIIQQVSPGMLFNLGDQWILNYSPTLFFYSSSHFRNTVSQSVQLGWGTAYGDWFFKGSQDYSSSSDPNIEVAGQLDQDIYATALSATYQLNDKMSMDVGLNQSLYYIGNGSILTNYEQNFANSKSWSAMGWFGYQFWPRLNAGIGVGFGYTIQGGSPDAINEQYQARVNWRATDKISFQLSGGLRDQQYLSGGAGDLVSPIYAASIQYQPFDQTRLSISASGTVTPSSFQDQTTESQGVNAGLNQRLLGILHLDLTGGYNTTKYIATQSGLSTGRNDDVYSFSARLSCPILKRANVSVFYAYSNDSSTQTGFASGYGFGYTTTQVGFEIGYSY